MIEKADIIAAVCDLLITDGRLEEARSMIRRDYRFSPAI